MPFLASPWRFLRHYVATRPWMFLGLALLVAAASIGSVGVQYAMKLLVDAMTTGIEPRTPVIAHVYRALAVFLGLVVLESMIQRAAAMTLGHATVAWGWGSGSTWSIT